MYKKTNTNEHATIYNTSYNSVVPINTFNALMEPQTTSTGFITDIVDNRIIICTSVHSLLLDYSNTDSLFYNSFSCVVSGAYQKGSQKPNKRPITVSIKILGVDMSADFAILYSIKQNEEDKFNPLGYNFSSRNTTLSFFTDTLQIGSPVYSFVNMYGSNISMINGIIVDGNIIYSPESIHYVNYVSQTVTTLPATIGASGAPVMINNNGKGEICGMIQWSKKQNAYTGGLSNHSLINIYQKIFNLNIVNGVINDDRLNFNGTTGKGYLGIISYSYINGAILSLLCANSESFKKSPYSNIIQGIIVSKYNTSYNNIPKSGLLNAVNISKRAYEAQDHKSCVISNNNINEGYIILELNGKQIGDTETDSRITDYAYYNANKYIFIKCLKISETEEPVILYFRTICDTYPAEYEYVSTTPDTELIMREIISLHVEYAGFALSSINWSVYDPITGDKIDN